MSRPVRTQNSAPAGLRRPRLTVLPLVAVLAFALVSCDDSDSGGSGAGSSTGSGSDAEQPKVTCDLADASDIFTPAFAEVYSGSNSYAANRCEIPNEASVIDAMRERGYTIDGISAIGGENGIEGMNALDESDAEHSVFYILRAGPCDYGAEVAYFPADEAFGPFKMDYPEVVRVSTPGEALDTWEQNHC